MMLFEEMTTRLSLAVIFNDAVVPTMKIPEDEVNLLAAGIEQEPIYKRPGYWLFMDVQENLVNLIWKTKHYENGEQLIDIDTLPSLSPVVPIPLVKPPPVTITFSSFTRGREGVPYGRWVTTSGGKPPLFFEAVDLPAGLTIDSSSGLVSGIPTENIRVYVTLKVTDINGTHDEMTKRITILE